MTTPQAESAGSVAIFEPKERRTEQLNVRISKRLKKALEDLAAVWTHVQRVEADDPDAEVGVTDVVTRLLELGIQNAWEELEIDPPKDEASVEAAKKRAVEFYSRIGRDLNRKRSS